jgi:Undecaprenyl-phosphate galactose phosphotransferase WbaP
MDLIRTSSIKTELFDTALNLSAESLPNSTTFSRPLGTIACLMAADLAGVSVAMVGASALRLFAVGTPSAAIFQPLLAAVLLILCSFTAAGLYPGVTVNPVEELRRSSLAVTLAFCALWSATFFLHDLTPSRLVYAIGYLLTLCLIPLLRSAMRQMFAAQRWWGSAVAILGYGVTGKFVHETLIKNPRIGLKPVAVLDDNPMQFEKVATDLLRGPLFHARIITGSQRIPYGIVCMPGLSRHDLLTFLDFYGHCFGHLIVIPNLIGMTSLGISVREVGGVVGLEVRKQLLRPSARYAKRALDLTFTLLIAPVIAVIVGVLAICIKLEDGGPVFYPNVRIGQGGSRFKTWKLRSMHPKGDAFLETYLEAHPEEADTWQVTQKLKHDPRLTHVGRIIRHTSLDELPQFWNVLVGEMSVVGPRPILERQIPLYGAKYNLYKQVRPGITGLWQISGRNKLSFVERAKLDKYVIQNWSVWLDLYILARTPSAIFTGDGAY